MSNNKSLSERLNNIKDEGPDKWLSRELFTEEDIRDRLRRQQREKREAERGPRPIPTPKANSTAVNDAVSMGGVVQRMTDSPAGQAETSRQQALSTAADSVIAGAKGQGSQPPAVGNERGQQTQSRVNLELTEPSIDAKPSTSPIDMARDMKPDVDVEELRTNAENIRRSLIPDFGKMQQLYGEKEKLEETRLEPARRQIEEMKKRMEAEKDPRKKANLAAQHATFALQILMGETYSKKDRSGISRTLQREEAEQITRHSKDLLDGYGEGSRKEIESFVKGRKLYDTPIETARAFLASAPPELLKTLKSTVGLYSKGQQPYFDPKNPTGGPVNLDAKNLHYGGPDADRGGANSQARLEWLMKTMLDQGLADPYTGLPLNFDYMELDHVTDKMAPEDGPDVNPEGLPRLGSEEYRDHPDNWLWSSTSTNNVKNNYGLDFLVTRAKEMTDNEETFYPDRFFEEAARDQIGTHRDRLHQLMMTDGVMNENVTQDMIEHAFSSEQSLIDTITSQGGDEVENKAYRKIMQALGATTDQTQYRRKELLKPGEVTPSNQFQTPEILFRPFLNMLVGKTSEEQKQLIDTWSSSSERAKDSMADSAIMNSENWKTDKFVKTDKNDKFVRAGTYMNHFIKNAMEGGLINLEEIKKHTTTRQYNALTRMIDSLGLSSQD